MADKKISELNSLTGANAADGDLVAIVDVSATETKKITRSEFFTDTPSIEVDGTVTADAIRNGTANLQIRADDNNVQAASRIQMFVDGTELGDFNNAGYLRFNKTNFSGGGVCSTTNDSNLSLGGGVTPTNSGINLSLSGPDHIVASAGVLLRDGTTVIGGWNRASDFHFLSTGGSERLRITSTGSVGIGTSSPSATLQVNGDVYASGAGGVAFKLNNGTAIRSSTTSATHYMDLGTVNFRRGDGANTQAQVNVYGGGYFAGSVGIGTSSPTNLLDVNADSIRVRTAQTPATAGAAGNQGEIAWDANYIYICVATNTWKRVAISTW